MDKVVLFGAGPIGLGAAMWLKLRGAGHVAVADVIPARLETALVAGAGAVIDSSREDVTDAWHSCTARATRRSARPRPGTDIYIDAARSARSPHTLPSSGG